MVELRVQRDQLEQKLLVEQGRDDGVEYKQSQDDALVHNQGRDDAVVHNQGRDDGVEHEHKQGRDDALVHNQGREDADEQAASSSKQTSKQASKLAGKQEEEQQKPPDANRAKQRARKVNPDLETLKQEQEALNNNTLRLQGLKQTFLNTGAMTPLDAVPAGIAQPCQILPFSEWKQGHNVATANSTTTKTKVQGQNPNPLRVTSAPLKSTTPELDDEVDFRPLLRSDEYWIKMGDSEEIKALEDLLEREERKHRSTLGSTWLTITERQDVEFQIFVEAWIGAALAKKTIVLNVKSTTTVREVMEMLKKKVDSLAKPTLRTRADKYLLRQDLSLAECGVGKEATLILPNISYLIE